MARHQDSSDILFQNKIFGRKKIVKTLSVFCLCGHAEWSSWLMRRSAVSAWMERQTSFCPAHTASVRSALINGKEMDQELILIILFVRKKKVLALYDMNQHLTVIVTHCLLCLQEWAEPKLSDMSPAGDCCQRIVGTVRFPHRGWHSWLHPQLGWWCGPPTQALTHSTLSRLTEIDPYQVDFTCCNTKCHFHWGWDEDALCNPSIVDVVALWDLCVIIRSV